MHAMQNEPQVADQVELIKTADITKYYQRNNDGSAVCCWQDQYSKEYYAWRVYMHNTSPILAVNAAQEYSNLKSAYDAQHKKEKEGKLVGVQNNNQS